VVRYPFSGAEYRATEPISHHSTDGVAGPLNGRRGGATQRTAGRGDSTELRGAYVN